MRVGRAMLWGGFVSFLLALVLGIIAIWTDGSVSDRLGSTSGLFAVISVVVLLVGGLIVSDI